MASTETETQHVISNLRACLLSVKGGTPIQSLDRDYKILVGQYIPYRKLGFDSLEKFLKSIPDISISRSRTGEIILDAIPSKSTKHLTDLIARQKTAPKKIRPPRTYRTAASYSRAPSSNYRRNFDDSSFRGKRAPLSVTVHNVGRNQRSDKTDRTNAQSLPTPSHLRNGSSPLQLNYPALKSRSRRRHPEVPQVIPVMENELGAATSECLNYREELRRICRILNLEEPSFSVIPRFPHGGNEPIYGCIVRFNDYSYNSYPEEHAVPGEAAQIVAQIALEDLKKIHETTLSKQSLPETCDKDALMKRVAMIVVQYPNGLWSTQLPVDYKNKYFELLPQDWLTQMADCPFVTMDHIADNRIIFFPSEDCETLLNSLAAPIVEIDPEPLILPTSDNWDIFVTCATSTAEIWIRLIGEDYSFLYENMSLDMEILYADKENVAPKPKEGCLYALEMDGCWHRVRVETLEVDKAGVFFIDHGDVEESVNVNKLHVLEPQFISLPAQAVQCSLHGLEDFVDDPNSSKHLIDIVGKSLVAEVTSRGTEEEPATRVILYDTSSEDDVNLNQMLVEKMSKDVNAPQLPQTGDIIDAHISHITDTGDLYVQIDSDSYNYLETLIKQVIDVAFTPVNLKLARNHRNNMTKLYLSRYSADNRYYRAKIVEILSSDEVKVLFVDYGNTDVVPSSDLLLLEVLSKTLENFPPQAIKVNLYNVPSESFNSKLLDRVHELLPENEPVLIKMMELFKPSNGAEKLPLVEVFRRNSDNTLVSINNTLLVDPNFEKPLGRRHSVGDMNTHGKNTVIRLRSLNAGRSSPDSIPSPTSSLSPQLSIKENGDRVPQRSLSAPAIPGICNFFNVHVTMAANPSNFTVQPYDERYKLERLMTDIQQYYSSWPCPIRPPDTVIEGGLYAALYDDGYFYRACVSNVIGGNMVSVYFCDFGDVAVLPEDKLQPLADRFKELPYQAIKAKLSGIKPRHSDWSVEDCLRFQERVVEHVFVSIVMERGPDLLNPNDTCLGLQLIDTTGESDIKIDQLLVDEGRALFV